MSKKKKSKKKWEKDRKKYYGYGKKVKKSKRKGKSINGKYGYGGKKGMKTLHLSLSDKQAKKNARIIGAPVEVPKEFMEARLECNHVGRTMSVDEFKRITPSYAAFTPALDGMVAKYGADHVSVCGECYDVIVDRDQVDSDDVRDALLTLYAACNVVVGNTRLKKKEIKKINALKGTFSKYNAVMRYLDKVQKLPAATDDDSAPANPNRNLNNIPGSAFMG